MYTVNVLLDLDSEAAYILTPRQAKKWVEWVPPLNDLRADFRAWKQSAKDLFGMDLGYNIWFDIIDEGWRRLPETSGPFGTAGSWERWLNAEFNINGYAVLEVTLTPTEKGSHDVHVEIWDEDEVLFRNADSKKITHCCYSGFVHATRFDPKGGRYFKVKAYLYE